MKGKQAQKAPKPAKASKKPAAPNAKKPRIVKKRDGNNPVKIY